MDWSIVIIIIITVLVLLIWMIRRNYKDKKKLENTLDSDPTIHAHHPQKDHNLDSGSTDN